MNARRQMNAKSEVFAFFAAAVAASGTAFATAVANGDFETGLGTDITGWTLGEKGQAVWGVERGSGLNGNSGLVWKSDVGVDANDLVQDVAFVTGRTYCVEGYVKTELVPPPKGSNGADVCLQWYAADGKLLGELNPPKVRGTSDWTRVEAVMKAPLPPETARLVVKPYVVKGGTGRAAFDDISVKEFTLRPLGALCSSAYRNVAAEGTVRFFAPLFAPVASAEFAYVAADGARRTVAATVADGFASLAVPVAELAPGEQEVVCAVVADGVRETSTLRFSRVSELPKRKVYVDAKNRLIVDGKPFFPLGLCFHGKGLSEERNLKWLRGSPFNLVHQGHIHWTKKQLDTFLTNGLHVTYSLLDDYAGGRRAPKGMRTEADEIPWIESHVAQFRDHPAVLAWFVTDEPSVSFAPRIEKRSAWMATFDPDHPTFGIFNHIDRLREFLPTVDVFGTDIYPVPRKPVRTAADGTAQTAAYTYGSRCLVQVPQFFSWGDLKNLGPSMTAGGRFPTKAEMRAMCWQMIAHGANGLLGFAFNMMIDPKTGTERGPGWRDCVAVVGEIADRVPMILSDDDAPAVRGGTKDLAVRAFRRDGKILTVVCNLENRPAEAAISVPAAENPDVRLTLAPLEVRLLDMALKN